MAALPQPAPTKSEQAEKSPETERCDVGQLTFRTIQQEMDLDEVMRIEGEAFPSNEQANRERVSFRIQQAGDVFMGAFLGERMVAFVASTIAHDRLTQESLQNHDPQGNVLCLHSIAVEAARRRKGLGDRVLDYYLNHFLPAVLPAHYPNVREVRLIAKEHLSHFYQKHGFRDEGPSEVHFGEPVWRDFVRPFPLNT
ncbi:putative arylalkylamine N-acetyltransferase [Paratrimastix pyriformis]|uniref:Arylalkylamine N-acetyltransferase n=1 Tax=Paratrimastix pyriformis TaxID=342808 RepID=A0ABQ8UWP7_9EUKA|nr:putative arylalkylamine N-acetyltransferase [Paratrimastix pyriformis]